MKILGLILKLFVANHDTKNDEYLNLCPITALININVKLGAIDTMDRSEAQNFCFSLVIVALFRSLNLYFQYPSTL